MKKIIIIAIIISAIAFIILISLAIFIGFKTVKPQTEAINQKLVQDLSKVVVVPSGIPRPSYDFNQTVYEWEMETLAKEVTGVIFSYTPAFESNNNKIIASLSMPENGDPSIFNKILEAIIVDRGSLAMARDPQKAIVEASPGAGYSKIMLSVSPKTQQTTKITWEFDKKNLSPELNNMYKNLHKYPDFSLRFLYKIPSVVVGMLKG